MILGITESVVVVDAETASPVNLKKQGGARYWAHPGTRTLMVGYQPLREMAASRSSGLWSARTLTHGYQPLRENGPKVWEARKGDPPASLVAAAKLPPEKLMFAAFNAAFDREALAQVGIETPAEKWLDIMMLSYALSFAGRLEDVLAQFELGVQKNPGGKRLIQLFSSKQAPWYDYPEEWAQFRDYCADDVRVEADLLGKCLQWLDVPQRHPQMRDLQRQWLMVQRMNARGLPVSQATVDGALKIKKAETERLLGEMKFLTGLDNPNSVSQLLGWCNEQGAGLPNLQAPVLRDTLDCRPLPPAVVAVLERRLEVGKASVKKYDAIKRMRVDGRMKNCYTLLGASRTGRDASRGLNVVNLERPTLDDPDGAADVLETGDIAQVREQFDEPVMNVLGSCVRGAIKAPPGMFVSANDLKSIESVGLAWLAGCDTILNLFHEGKDSYKFFATLYYGVNYEDVTKAQRQFSKPPFLGFGFGASGSALVDYAFKMGVTMTEEEGIRAIQICRDTFQEIPLLWNNLENAAKWAIRNPGKTYSAFACEKFNEWNPSGHTYREWPRVDYHCDGTFLMCRIPSGRVIYYYDPKIVRREAKPDWWVDSIVYKGRKADQAGGWFSIPTWGGMQSENVDQAMCRDILYHGLEGIDRIPEIELIGSTYDEAITVLPQTQARELFARKQAAMLARPPWLDDRFFLGCKGYWDAPRYRK